MSQKTTEDLIRRAFETGDFTGWFEAVYASASEGTMKIPWAQMQPAEGLVRWASEARPQGEGLSALVVGCGLGDDAEFLAGLGYAVTAFDVSPSAIASAQSRFPQSRVRYQVADLLDLPVEWRHNFDFVLEHRTIQALPWHFCQPAIEAISAQVRHGGQVLVITHGREPHEDKRGIPWRLSREELAHFLAQGLREVRFDDVQDPNGRREFRVLYQRDDSGQYTS
ncbi:MAG: class I SAM-dependent methyltransferase [Anaerolineae bacterium]|nr:class I SAM-dependent methyltransferase [Anaerolineae bacterium]MDW8173408.1 class I SAM-dependent methyltransferase [Anaerolineae bacterium]